MRTVRLYTPVPLVSGTKITLTATAFHHAVRVLRLRPGSPMILFNGQGGEFEAVLEEVHRREAVVNIIAFLPIDRESPLTITLAQGICKGERMDFALQKAVELGITAIAPIITARSPLPRERSQQRWQHWQGVITSACEQCGRNRLPLLFPPGDLSTYLINQNPAFNSQLKLLLNPLAKHSLNGLTKANQIIVLCGPEGGFESTEIAAAEQQGFISVHLGPRILRTETAGITVLAALQSRWGDLA